MFKRYLWGTVIVAMGNDGLSPANISSLYRFVEGKMIWRYRQYQRISHYLGTHVAARCANVLVVRNKADPSGLSRMVIQFRA